MKKYFSAAFLFCFLTIACTKEAAKPGGDCDMESPVIKVSAPVSNPTLQPGEYLDIKALVTDNKAVQYVSWEAKDAAIPCGNSPYRGEFSIFESSYELNIRFLVPSHYAGDRLIRIQALDNSGNLGIHEVHFTATD